MIWRTRSASPRTRRGTSGATPERTTRPRSRPSDSKLPKAEATASRRSKGSSASSTWPASIFDRSSTSETMPASSSAEPIRWPRYSRRRAGASDSSCSSRARPITPLSGVRISWLMVARKALLASLAISACRLASASSRSARRRSVMSSATQIVPRASGRCASTGRARSRASTGTPSGRTYLAFDVDRAPGPAARGRLRACGEGREGLGIGEQAACRFAGQRARRAGRTWPRTAGFTRSKQRSRTSAMPTEALSRIASLTWRARSLSLMSRTLITATGRPSASKAAAGDQRLARARRRARTWCASCGPRHRRRPARRAARPAVRRRARCPARSALLPSTSASWRPAICRKAGLASRMRPLSSRATVDGIGRQPHQVVQQRLLARQRTLRLALGGGVAAHAPPARQVAGGVEQRLGAAHARQLEAVGAAKADHPVAVRAGAPAGPRSARAQSASRTICGPPGWSTRMNSATVRPVRASKDGRDVGHQAAVARSASKTQSLAMSSSASMRFSPARA